MNCWPKKGHVAAESRPYEEKVSTMAKVESAAPFSRKFTKYSKNLDDRLRTLLQGATVDAIHDLRTTIRKMEAAVDLLPKKIRKKEKFRRYLASSKKLFKSTSPVRDADIIISNLREFEELPSVSTAISRLQSERDQRIFSVLDRAETLSEIKIPKLKKNQAPVAQMNKRKTKLSLELQFKIAELVPTILRDFRKIDELHDLRKYCKSLRYLLDTLPTEKEGDLRRLMEEWQKLLGNVRDMYMTQHFIEENNLQRELGQWVISMNAKRDRILESFIHSAEDHVNTSSQTITVVKAIAE